MNKSEQDNDAPNKDKANEHVHHDDILHFIKSKPPFGYMFPLHCFDNFECDIRPPEEWLSLGWDTKEKRFFPLPAKAFLPMPGPSAKKNLPALSETIVDNNLLTATPRLTKMYHWLLRERFQRTVEMLGIDPKKC